MTIEVGIVIGPSVFVFFLQEKYDKSFNFILKFSISLNYILNEKILSILILASHSIIPSHLLPFKQSIIVASDAPDRDNCIPLIKAFFASSFLIPHFLLPSFVFFILLISFQRLLLLLLLSSINLVRKAKQELKYLLCLKSKERRE